MTARRLTSPTTGAVMQSAHPTVLEVQTRLKAAHQMVGGKFSLTFSVGAEVECYVTHWHRPEPHAFEQCVAVGTGTLRECLDAVDRYVASQAPALAAE